MVDAPMRGDSRSHGRSDYADGGRHGAGRYSDGSGRYADGSPGYSDGWAPSDGWTSATHTDVASPRRAGGNHVGPEADASATASDDGYTVRSRTSRQSSRRAAWGLPGWMALLILLVIAGIGGVVDMSAGAGLKGGFNVALVVACTLAILIVRRDGMFPIVIAPPLVYALGSAVALYIRSGGKNEKKVIIDAAQNWLVYGFPAVAGATAIVLIVAAIRMFIRK